MNYTMTVIKAFNIACNSMCEYEVRELLLDAYADTLDIDNMTTPEWVATVTKFDAWLEKIYPYVVNFGDAMAIISVGKWDEMKELTDFAISRLKFRAVALTDEKREMFDRLFAYEVTYDSRMTKYIKIKTIPKK